MEKKQSLRKYLDAVVNNNLNETIYSNGMRFYMDRTMDLEESIKAFSFLQANFIPVSSFFASPDSNSL